MYKLESFQVAPHPGGSELDSLITEFGKSNSVLGIKDSDKSKKNPALAAWFVSNCYSKSGREKAFQQLKRYLSSIIQSSEVVL